MCFTSLSVHNFKNLHRFLHFLPCAKRIYKDNDNCNIWLKLKPLFKMSKKYSMEPYQDEVGKNKVKLKKIMGQKLGSCTMSKVMGS